MKQLVLFIFTTISFLGFSQNNSLNIFSQDGDPFFVIVNGEKRNNNAETNVTVDGLNKDVMYKVKVIFADGVTPDVDKSFFFEKDNQLMTASIVKKMKNGKVDKVKLRYAGLTEKEVANTSNSGTTNSNTTYNNSGSANNNSGTTYNNSSQNNTGTYNSNSGTGNNNSGTTTTTTTSTTTSTTNAGSNGGSVDVNVTDPNTGENINMGININIGENGATTNTNTNSSSSTTTTTYSSTTTTSSSGNTDYNSNNNYSNNNNNNSGYNENVPTYVPGYDGTIGCNNVLVNEREILQTIEDESFSDDKMMILKQATKTKCVSADQVVSFMGKFDFEKDQLEAAKFLYEKTYDQDNYYKVISALEFSSSKDDLKEYIDNSSVDNSGYNSNVPTYVPGYSGSIGCNNVLINEDEIQDAMEEESFSDDKMMILKQATKTKCVSTDQVLTLLGEFDFDKDKVEAAKYLYDKTYDQDNYFKVINSFDFSSTKEELNEYIEGR